jgi:hypothetical protein
VELKGIGAIPMRLGSFQAFGEVDDVDRLEGTFLHANATADAQLFGKEGDFTGRGHLNA